MCWKLLTVHFGTCSVTTPLPVFQLRYQYYNSVTSITTLLPVLQLRYKYYHSVTSITTPLPVLQLRYQYCISVTSITTPLPVLQLRYRYYNSVTLSCNILVIYLQIMVLHDIIQYLNKIKTSPYYGVFLIIFQM